ncbi:hypothetical protein [Streptomyces sp. NPDC090021]|uniref:hypothetical protein n=1 Tax=Streptomyces sp. NPDC090021 TaxID=3365919 RepID=UPI00380FB861
MSETWFAIGLASAGVLLSIVGAALYVLPGPGIPVLAIGVTLLVAGVGLLGADAGRG